LKIAILGKQKTWYTRALQTAFKARGIEAPCFPVTRLVGATGSKLRLSIGNESLENYQAVLVHSIPDFSKHQIGPK